MKEHNHIVNYLHRWTVCKLGKLHVRIHHILSSDGTPFLHNHPFWYVSIVWKGWYEEQVLVGNKIVTRRQVAPTIIVRKPSTYHRITKVSAVCKTLFFAWKSGDWKLINHPDVVAPPDYTVPNNPGVYYRCIKGVWTYAKFDAGRWWVGSPDINVATTSDTLSIYQTGGWREYE